MSAPLRLVESSPAISELCRTVERALAAIPDLAGLTLKVEPLRDFDSFPEVENRDAMRQTGAAYRRSTQTVYVNCATFFTMGPEQQVAILAHEIAHALSHLESLLAQCPSYSEFSPTNGEELLADHLVCQWGFIDSLRTQRLIDYGPKYVAALDQWQDEAEYRKAMHLYIFQKNAGIV